ncbi:hypothetical protein [Pseudonocardia cypriaca]|uniref:Major capsid protein E n=1 Tax=Pseudonocardia cypriaca TaxID=882449 RepID=A0A543GDI0_9PSEU|nr:hypothetical protein [Pseudonocardia cypriaca]TQM44116.1 hypothetical protein FB388_1478 [Pseudonocardia cypriaca]
MARGISTAGDIVAASIDGADLEAMFREFQATLAIRNEERTAVANFLSFPTVRSADGVAQTTDQDGFERASEFGEPVSLAAPPDVVTMGYDFNDHDLATRFTARYLRDATAAEIEAIHRRALAADNKLVNTEILKRLLDPTPGENSDGKTVYGLWTGTDGMRPPHYAFRTFPANHSHYLTTGSATPDGADLDALISTIREHGYGTQAGSQLVLFLNPDELPPIVAIRAGSGTLQAQYDYLPGAAAPAYLTDQTIIGDIAPAEIGRLPISGSYGPMWIVATDVMPPDYLLAVATDGPNSDLNPVGFRQHPNAAHQGLRLLPGNQTEYPLTEAFYTRAFGVGVRHRGAAAVMQITTSTTYTPPVL